MNTSLLQDMQYVAMVKREIQSTILDINSDTTTDLDNQMIFEMIKLNIRGKTMSYSSYKAKCEKTRNKLWKIIFLSSEIYLSATSRGMFLSIYCIKLKQT